MIDTAKLDPAVHWKDAYAHVADRARAYLTSVQASALSTAALAGALYDGTDTFTRQRVFKALKAGASHSLADCWTPGTGTAFGKTVVRKLWHAPAVKRCPHCQGVL